MRSDIELLLDGDFAPGSFDDALCQFLRAADERGVSEHHIRHLYDSLSPLNEWLAGRPLASLKPRELKGFVDDELRPKYAPGTLRPMIGDIKQFFRWCKKKGLMKKNIAKRIRKPGKRPTRKSRPPSDDTVSAVAEMLTERLKGVVYRDVFGNLVAEPAAVWSHGELESLRDLFMVVFLYETGSRAGELATLSSAAMDRAIEPGGRIFVITVYGKTDDEDLFFTVSTAELWRLWCSVRPVNTDFAVYSMASSSVGARLRTNGISQMLVRRCRAAGVTVFRAHALRHAKVQRVRRLAGMELATTLMGHSSSVTTAGYANVTDDEVTDAVLKSGLRLHLFGRNGSGTGAGKEEKS